MTTRKQQTRIEHDPVFCMPAALTLKPIVPAPPELTISPLSLGHFRTTFRARRHPTLAVWINTNLEAPNAAHLRVAMSASSFLVSAEREFIAAKKLPKLALPRHHGSGLTLDALEHVQQLLAERC